MHSVDNDSPGLWETLYGLNIKMLSLGEDSKRLHVNLKELFWQCISSLTHLKTHSIEMDCDFSSLRKALRGLNINDLSLNVWCRSLRVKHVESMSQSISSLIRMETLSIGVDVDKPGLWEALRGLNIKSLNERCKGLRVKHVELMSQSLSSLICIEMLSIGVDEDSPGQWEALSGLNIKSLSLSGRWSRDVIMNHF
ncbi:hypothetical protein DPMN_164861 [Dreissena polymorpha]|uniref:Uncharacterized protein n=1 Tax=Dreissena polymorpha TaxID=45954 RepID=A0A9D4EZI7_DREPO|nr:hypothetical protein DPMN_164861 [Dreissena polymorpha]